MLLKSVLRQNVSWGETFAAPTKNWSPFNPLTERMVGMIPTSLHLICIRGLALSSTTVA